MNRNDDKMMNYPKLHELPAPDRLDCGECAEWLPLFADGECSGPIAHAVAEHVRQCRRCEHEARELRALITSLRQLGAEQMAADQPGRWQALHAAVMAEIAEPPQARRWYRSPAARWAGGLAMAAALLALAVTPLRHAVDDGLAQAEETVDARAVLGSAKEAVATDRAFVDDLAAAGEDDPLDTIDDLDDLDDVDLDALGTALDDEAAGGQGA